MGKHKRSRLGASHLNAVCCHRSDELSPRKEFWVFSQLNALFPQYFLISAYIQCVIHLYSVYTVFKCMYPFHTVQDIDGPDSKFHKLIFCLSVKSPLLAFSGAKAGKFMAGRGEEPLM